MRLLLHSAILIVTLLNFPNSLVDGVSVRRHLNSGAGWLDSNAVLPTEASKLFSLILLSADIESWASYWNWVCARL